MSKLAKILLGTVAAAVGAFLVTFVIYFFNLDMKFMSYVVDPILQKHYDNMPHNYYV